MKQQINKSRVPVFTVNLVKKLLSIIHGVVAFSFAAVWITGWSAGTLFLDATVARDVYLQLIALTYPTTTGEILKSELVVRTIGEDTNTIPAIQYRYRVGDQDRTGDTSDRTLCVYFGRGGAAAIVARNPVGKKVRVHYHPQDPDISELSPELTAGHAFYALFLTPFNIVMLGSWTYAWRCLYRRPLDCLPRNTRLRTTDEGFTLQIYDESPVVYAAGTALGSTFCGSFVAIFAAFILPFGLVMAGVWSVVVGLTFWVYARTASVGVNLRVSELRGSFTLSHGVRTRRVVAGQLDSLRGCDVVSRSKTDSEMNTTETFAVVLRQECKGDRPRRYCLFAGWKENEARQLSNWLTRRLNLGKGSVGMEPLIYANGR